MRWQAALHDVHWKFGEIVHKRRLTASALWLEWGCSCLGLATCLAADESTNISLFMTRSEHMTHKTTLQSAHNYNDLSIIACCMCTCKVPCCLICSTCFPSISGSNIRHDAIRYCSEWPAPV
eukprot:GHUV01040358.1.p1 GENE.GHUV01040358.1~~GHUV01040358.1.p1  ORF type:complete len:122 (-),score=1.71 GHUV01040358.1:820-1185(-)